MVTAQNVTNWFDLQNVSKSCIFKVRKFQRDTLSRFRMGEEKQEGPYFPPPPCKIGLRPQRILVKSSDVSWPPLVAESSIVIVVFTSVLSNTKLLLSDWHKLYFALLQLLCQTR